MVSFSFKKKDDTNIVKKQTFGFFLKKSTSPSPSTPSKLQLKLPTKQLISNDKKPPSPFAKGNEIEEPEEEKVIKIDTVDSHGSYDQSTGPGLPQKKEILIIPNSGNKWEKRALKDLTKRKRETEDDNDVVARTDGDHKKLKFGLNFSETKKQDEQTQDDNGKEDEQVNDTNENESESDYEEPTTKDYSAIPISSFGEAMLRGMGWDPDASDSDSEEAQKNNKKKSGDEEEELPKRSQFLGLGAKDIYDGEGRADREYIPVKLVEKRL